MFRSFTNFLKSNIVESFSDSLKKILGVFFLAVLLVVFYILKDFFLQEMSIPLWVLTITGIGLMYLLYVTYHNRYSIKPYKIALRSVFNNGSDPKNNPNYSKWNFRSYTKYYYIPLISVSYPNVRNFIEVVGPFCSKCDNMLFIKENLLGVPRFHCVGCDNTFSLPNELLYGYNEKVQQYFKNEFTSKRLK